MIAIAELRIGNILIDARSGTLLMVESLSRKGVNFDFVDKDLRNPLAEGWQAVGVPLTPEVLECCTFPYYWIKDCLCKNTIRDGSGNYAGYYIHLKRSEDIIYKPVLIKCHYLHELQNAVFTLCHEELQYMPS